MMAKPAYENMWLTFAFEYNFPLPLVNNILTYKVKSCIASLRHYININRQWLKLSIRVFSEH